MATGHSARWCYHSMMGIRGRSPLKQGAIRKYSRCISTSLVRIALDTFYMFPLFVTCVYIMHACLYRHRSFLILLLLLLSCTFFRLFGTVHTCNQHNLEHTHNMVQHCCNAKTRQRCRTLRTKTDISNIYVRQCY